MKIKSTKAWKEAEMEYEFLNSQTLVTFFDSPLSRQDIIDRLEMIVKGCPNFYPALLDLAFRKLSSGGGTSVERQIDKGFHLMLELATSEHLDDELDILVENLENLWRFDLSRYYLEILIERYPYNASLHDSLAHAAAWLGNVEAALLYIGKAVQLEPDNFYFKSNQGWYQLMAGNLKEAGQALEAALLINAGDEVVKGNLKIHEYLSKRGGNYFDYLLRPVEEGKIDQLKNEEEWEKVDKMYTSYND